MAKIIFITGASRGFGRIWAQAFLERGDKVVGTSRTINGLNDLAEQYGASFLPLEVDVTNREACAEAVQLATAHFGRIDVLINNAGTGLLGSVEEVNEQAAREIMEVNFFATLWMTQTVLPVFRAQGNGHILQVSSALGIYAFATLGLYSASKFAVEGLSEALLQEVKGFGINVTLIEPNGYATDFGASAVKSEAIPAYDQMKAELYARPEMTAPDAYGNPQATAAAVLTLVDAPNPPARLILGKKALPIARHIYAERLAAWESWEDVSIKAHGQ